MTDSKATLASGSVLRHASVIGIRPDRQADYVELHRRVWPEVIDEMRHRNLRNFGIYMRDSLLFRYFEYTGVDLAADLQLMSQSEDVRRWMELTDACQVRLPTATDEWWATAAEVFHTD